MKEFNYELGRFYLMKCLKKVADEYASFGISVEESWFEYGNLPLSKIKDAITREERRTMSYACKRQNAVEGLKTFMTFQLKKIVVQFSIAIRVLHISETIMKPPKSSSICHAIDSCLEKAGFDPSNNIVSSDTFSYRTLEELLSVSENKEE